MKTLFVTTFLIGFISMNVASAAQHINHTDGKQKIGVVSTSNAYTLNDLSNELSRKADEQGATSFIILSITGNYRLHGYAEIYK